MKDGIDIYGAVADTYTISAANSSDIGSYSVRVSNSCSQIDSDAATLGLLAKPSILVQPAGQIVCDGSPVTFSVQASDSEPLAYQWMKDGIDIYGAVADTYTISAANSSDIGSYSVRDQQQLQPDRFRCSNAWPPSQTINPRPACRPDCLRWLSCDVQRASERQRAIGLSMDERRN